MIFISMLSCFAAVSSACAAWFSFRNQKHIEKNREEAIKNKYVVSSFHGVMLTFAKIRTTSNLNWSKERNDQLKVLTDELTYHLTMASSLNKGVGDLLFYWKNDKSESNYSVSSLVYSVLGNQGSSIGNKYDDFFIRKARELEEIQDFIFFSFKERKSYMEKKLGI